MFRLETMIASPLRAALVGLYNAHIDEYAYGNLQNHLPKAPRRLLLHKAEIRKLFGLAAVKGNALFPL